MDYSSYFRNKNIVITGHTGFKGSWLSQWLYMLGAKISAFSLDIPSTPDHYNELKIKYIADERINLIDSKKVFKFISDAKPDYLFHLAAQPLVLESYRNQYNTYMSNTMGTLNILEATKKLDSLDLFLHTSTSEVYGSAQTVPISESHPLVGQSPYAASKIAADKLAESFHLSFDLPLVTVRPFNTFGPRQTARAIIPTIISQLISKPKFLKLGSLFPTRDFNFVLDTASAFKELSITLSEFFLFPDWYKKLA